MNFTYIKPNLPIFQGKTRFHLRMAEIVRENSKDFANVIVMTLPMPKRLKEPPYSDEHTILIFYLFKE